MQEEITEACKKLLAEHPTGIKIRYKDMGICWPHGVYPSVLINSIRDNLAYQGIRVETGQKFNGGSAVLITKIPSPFDEDTLDMNSPLPPLSAS